MLVSDPVPEVKVSVRGPWTKLQHLDRSLEPLHIDLTRVHTPEGSTVSLTWGHDGPEAVIAVLDEGPGISPADAEAAFLRFRRGAARPAGRGGTGLGLAIVGALAARWGGSASLQARPEGGTRAEIRLPAFAIGGINRENLQQVLAAGFRRVAVSSAVAGAADPAAVARELLALLD